MWRTGIKEMNLVLVLMKFHLPILQYLHIDISIQYQGYYLLEKEYNPNQLHIQCSIINSNNYIFLMKKMRKKEITRNLRGRTRFNNANCSTSSVILEGLDFISSFLLN